MRLALVVLMLSSTANLLAAQSHRWGLTGEIGLSWFAGSSRRDSVGVDYLHPSPSRSAALRIDRAGGRVGLALTLLYEKTGLQDEADDVSVTINDVVKLYSVRPEVFVTVLRLRSMT